MAGALAAGPTNGGQWECGPWATLLGLPAPARLFFSQGNSAFPCIQHLIAALELAIQRIQQVL